MDKIWKLILGMKNKEKEEGEIWEKALTKIKLNFDIT